MNDNIKRKDICQAIERAFSYAESLLDATSYDDIICYLLGVLSHVEMILVYIGNMRFASKLTEKQIQVEEQIFDEWMVLYNIAKVIITKRNYSVEYKMKINEHTEILYKKLKKFEMEIHEVSV